MMLDRIKKHWDSRPLSALFVVFLILFLGFSVMYGYSAGDPLLDDHYFHFKYAYLLRTEGMDVVNHFDWIYLSGHGKEGGSRYAVTLYQISLIPFTYFDNWLLAIHIADAFYTSLALALFYYVLRKAHVQYPFFFIMAMFSSIYFIERLLYGRAFVLAIALVFLEMYFAVEKKYKLLFCVCVFHILWHQSTYFMPLFFVGIVEAARYLIEQKMFLKNAFSVILATVVGMAFFPGFPQSLFLWIGNIINIQMNAQSHVQDVNSVSIGGGEMVSKDFMNYFTDEKILLFLFVLACSSVISLYVLQKRSGISFLTSLDQKKLIWIYALFMGMICMMAGSITISGRIFDFFIPTVFILSAFLVTFFADTKKITVDHSLGVYMKFGVGMFFGILFLNTCINVYATAQQFDYMPAQQTAQWIQDHSSGRDKVFLHNWSVFTLMFFTNSHNIYSTGIEPMALKSFNEELYWKYYNIFKYNYYCDDSGDCGDTVMAIKESYKVASDEKKDKFEKDNGLRIIHSIKNDFDAKFIVSETEAFTKTIQQNPDLIEDQFHVKSDDFTGRYTEFTVFKLK